MSTAIEITDLHRRYGSALALDGVTFTVAENTVCGLLGRNGAGKTTVMAHIAGQERPSGGTVRVFGHDPVDDATVLSRTSFIRDDQRYPDDFRLTHLLSTAPAFHRGWDAELAASLVADFRLSPRTAIKKMSRGQASAVSIVVGLASRAPLTIFDEPYLGLDATARQIFYDRLLSDYAEHPRTILLSTHLIDEMEPLLEQVVVLDRGRVRLDCDVDEARASAFAVAGTTRAVQGFLAGRRPLSTHTIGGLMTATVDGAADAAVRADADRLGVELSRVTLQQVVAALGADADPDPIDAGADTTLATTDSEGARS